MTKIPGWVPPKCEVKSCDRDAEYVNEMGLGYQQYVCGDHYRNEGFQKMRAERDDAIAALTKLKEAGVVR